MSSPDVVKAETVIAEVELHWGAPCGECARPLIGHDVVVSMLMGVRDDPRCAACLAAGVRDSRDTFLRRAHASVKRLDCYRAGWAYSDRRLARLAAPWPEERIPSALRCDALEDEESDSPAPVGAAPQMADAASPAPPEPHARFDAGAMSCGDLVLELRQRLAELPEGAILEVRAVDPGAPEDLPAWCRVTRNPMVHADAPRYWIRRRAT